MCVKLLIAGLDPHLRDRMRGAGKVDYVPGYKKDKPISGSLPIAEYTNLPPEILDLWAMATPVV
jgi:hypothetical protein